jgi:hypothetical protein
MGLSLMNMLTHLRQVYISHILHVIENSFFCTTQVLSQYRLCRAPHACLTYLMLQRQPSYLNGRKLDTTNFKHLIFSMSVFTLYCTANIFVPMILYDFCLLPAQFCHIIVYIRKVKSCVHWLISKSYEYANCSMSSWYSLYTDRTENITSRSSSIVSCICCLAMALVLLRAYEALA